MNNHPETKEINVFLVKYLIAVLSIAISALVVVYTLYYCYKKKKFCFRPSDKDENIPNQLRTSIATASNENIPGITEAEAKGGTVKTVGRILLPSVIPCGFIDDTNFTDIDLNDAKNDIAPSPMTRCMPTQTSIKISTEIVNPR